MYHILVPVCCPPQNEHIYIKKDANSHVEGTLKRRQKRLKIHVLLLLLLRHTFFSRQFLRNYYNNQHK